MSGRNGYTNPGLVLIDMHDFFLNSLDLNTRNRLIISQEGMLEYGLKNDLPVFMIEYKGAGETISSLKNIVSLYHRKHTILKNHDSGFIETDLELKFRKEEVHTPVLMGVNAAVCVMDTAKGALKRKFKIATAGDLIADQPGEVYVPWYANSGLFKEHYRQLIDYFSSKRK